MQFSFVVFLILILFNTVPAPISVSASSPCGSKVTIVDAGVNKIIQETLPQVLSKIRDLNLPTYNGAFDYLGKIDYSVSNINLSSFDVQNFQIDIIQGQGPVVILWVEKK